MMMRYTFQLPGVAIRIETAVRKALASGLRTGDIARKGEKICRTQEMGSAVIANL
jgi:3-isopropylmalate dehydrogenase